MLHSPSSALNTSAMQCSRNVSSFSVFFSHMSRNTNRSDNRPATHPHTREENLHLALSPVSYVSYVCLCVHLSIHRKNKKRFPSYFKACLQFADGVLLNLVDKGSDECFLWVSFEAPIPGQLSPLFSVSFQLPLHLSRRADKTAFRERCCESPVGKASNHLL